MSAAVRRKRYTLSEIESAAFRKLPAWAHTGHHTWRFWQGVAAARDLDYTTIICDPDKPGSFTALPEGHGKHWCWPAPLKCKPAPQAYLTEVPRHG